MTSAIKWTVVLIIGLLFITSCHCSRSKSAHTKIDIRQVTLQKMIPGEMNQNEYWQIKWSSPDSIFYAVYFNHFYGLIGHPKDTNYNINLHVNQSNIPASLEKLLKKDQLVFEVKNPKGKEYIVVEKFNILNPVNLPNEEVKN